MDDTPDISSIAQLLAEPARAAMLWALIDGTMRPAGELAYTANVSAQSASTHLAKLVKGGLLVAEAQGRHRYFRLASSDVANMVESMASLSAGIVRPEQSRSIRKPALARAMPNQFLHARTCYDHLAGNLAVKLLEAMLHSGWLMQQGKDFELTAIGEGKLTPLGIKPAPTTRRAFARVCVDLTERRPHLGGALGAALLTHFHEQGWILRSPKSRTVSITPRGEEALRSFLNLDGFRRSGLHAACMRPNVIHPQAAKQVATGYLNTDKKPQAKAGHA
jgi:DNA-binding transcriptional ArsR family regulator